MLNLHNIVHQLYLNKADNKKFIPDCFLMLFSMEFSSTFTDSLLLEYRHATDFWVLILYPETSLNSCIGSNSFLMEPLGFAMQANNFTPFLSESLYFFVGYFSS